MSETLVTYKATQDCRFGGLYRKKGEAFAHKELSTLPPFLEKVQPSAIEKSESAKGKAKSPTIPKNAQAGKEDIGAGKPTSSSDVTSKDMLE